MAIRRYHLLVAALLAALAAIGLAVSSGSGSSHREAPLSSIDPTGDDTDVYAFVAPDAPNSLTLVANWIPFEDPAGGPNFYRFDDRASYYLNVETPATASTTSATSSSSRPRLATRTRSCTRCLGSSRSTTPSSTSSRRTRSGASAGITAIR